MRSLCTFPRTLCAAWEKLVLQNCLRTLRVSPLKAPQGRHPRLRTFPGKARSFPRNKIARRGTSAPAYEGGAVMRNACGARGAFSRAVGDAGPYRVQRGQTVRGRAAAWGHAALRKCIQSGRRGTLAPPYEAVWHKGCILVRRIQQKARSTAAGLLVVFTYL